MTDAKLKSELDALLRADLKNRGHIESGSLYKSINFIVVDGKISLEANDYIQYLDDGKFLYSFFKSNAFLYLIGDYVSDEIVEDINKKI
jgi:hypothetical protein